MLRSSAHLNDNLFHFLLEAQKMKMRQQKFSPSFYTNNLLTDLFIQRVPMTMHMGREHATREKKLPMVIFLIFVQKNVSTIRFQEIKIRP